MVSLFRKNYRPAKVPKHVTLSDTLPTGRKRDVKFTRYSVFSWLRRNVVLLFVLLSSLGVLYVFFSNQHYKFSLPTPTLLLHHHQAVVETEQKLGPAGREKAEESGTKDPRPTPKPDPSRKPTKKHNRTADSFNVKSRDGVAMPWKWANEGGLWRRTYPKEVLDKYNGGQFARPEITWFERRTVQDRLSFSKYINCSEERKELPTLEGLRVKSKLQINDFIVHQGNFERLGKGPDMNRTDRVRNVELLPPDGESVLLSREWGSCAIVGNSGHLHFSEYIKSIDSHDTVVRINQAPTRQYWRRVGKKTTHRVLNRLWTRTYRNSKGQKKGEILPMEENVNFIVTRANTQEYELLQEYLSETRPDVGLMYMSSRATSMAQPLLAGYREKLCQSGRGPYQGLLVPSSGYVIIYFLVNLCDSVSVYGFGVKPIKDGPQDYPYHYYKGVGSRKVGDAVHSFDSEEMLLKQLDRENIIKFCMYKSPKNSTHNWGCGCQHDDLEDCRPDPLPQGTRDSQDCTVEDCETKEERDAKKTISRRRQKQRIADRERRERLRQREQRQRNRSEPPSPSPPAAAS